jgi:type VI secretion system protein ImpA
MSLIAPHALPDLHALSTALEGADGPCGPNLEYDAQFVALEAASLGTPERQAGDTILAAEPPRWDEVLPQALAVARGTRDLRVAVLVMRGAAHLHGVRGYAKGLSMVAELLDTQWDHVHPRLDADEGGDATMRLNALAPLADAQSALGDLRHAAIGTKAHALTVRQVELAFGKVDAHEGETKPSRDAIVAGLQAVQAQQPGTLEALAGVRSALQRIQSCIAQRVSATAGPSLRPLDAVAAALEQAAHAASGRTTDASNDAHAGTDVAGQARNAPGELRTRDDVAQALERAAAWIESHEPSNPAPLLIRRAQRLLSKSFLEIMRDIAPDGLGQVERIAGVTES